jgi:hypothetical protein
MNINWNVVCPALATKSTYNHGLDLFNIKKQIKASAHGLVMLMTMRDTGDRRETIRSV